MKDFWREPLADGEQAVRGDNETSFIAHGIGGGDAPAKKRAFPLIAGWPFFVGLPKEREASIIRDRLPIGGENCPRITE
jgi:hypothetical protein